MAASWTDSFAVLLVISAPEHKFLYGHEYFLIKLTLKMWSGPRGGGGLRKWSSRWLAETKGRDANATLQQHETLSGLRPGRGSGISNHHQSIPSRYYRY